MKTIKKNRLSNFGIIISCVVILFNINLIIHPLEMIDTAREGLLLWFNQVLPSLLPFAVGANLLAGLGFIHFLGALTASVMIPLFRVPGAGSYALLTGLTSGYPMGAKAVAYLRETKQLQQDEAQRLLAFSNNAGPLFVVGFVGTSLLGSPRAGYILLISHVAAAIGLGLLLRFWGKPVPYERPEEGSLRLAFRRYRDFRENSYGGFGQVLGDSVRNAMETMVLVGGFIIVFCVVIKTLEVIGLFDVYPQGEGFIAGLIEVANGARILAQGGPPDSGVLAATAALISFGGFSVHGQTAHFIRHTDIKFGPYLAAKCLQAVGAGGICLVITRYIG